MKLLELVATKKSKLCFNAYWYAAKCLNPKKDKIQESQCRGFHHF